jgi:ribonuclease J
MAQDSGLTAALAPNGTMLDLTGERPQVAEMIETGRTYLDGAVQIGALDGIVRDRIRMALNGHVVVTLIFDEDDEPLGEPWVELSGLAETGRSNAPLTEVLEEALAAFLNRASDKVLLDDDLLEKDLRIIARRTTENEIGKKPEVTVVISRLT